MAMYYLAQGGDVTGPFGEGRILEMGDAGELALDAQVALHGTEDWFPAADLLGGLREDREARKPAPKIQRAERIKKRPMQWISLFIFLVGVGISIMFHWVVGVIVIVASVALDSRTVYVCGSCGNRIEKTSVICPACRAQLCKKLPKKAK